MNRAELWNKYLEEKSKIVIEQNKLVDCPEEFYFDAPGMNASSLNDILRSPAHFFARRVLEQKKKETPAMKFGKLLHCAVLEPQLFLSKKVIERDFDKRTVKGKEDYKKWVSDMPQGAIVVTDEHAYMLTRIITSVREHPIANGLLKNGAREKSVWWTDKETGELCKMKLDFLTEKGIVVDLKTTEDARENSFSRSIFNYGYHVQAGWYTEGVKQGLGLTGDRYVFLAVEKDEPFEVGVYAAGPTVLGKGTEKCREALTRFVECKKRNDWPGYTRKAITIELPHWALWDEQ